MMLTTAALILIVTCEVLGQDCKVRKYSLDMAPDSVDDQYDGCSKSMARKVETQYLNKEISVNISGFGTAWKNGTKKTPVGKDNLAINHLIALDVYTGIHVYNAFNNAVRAGNKEYKNLTFGWYSLHFWLTEALQILKKTQKGCKKTYRGTNAEFNNSNKEIRLGSFTSSSLDQNVTKGFGNVSCFEIYTCHGADVTKYSQYPHQKEVLIPPFEKFIVSDVKKRDQDDVWCETVYMLKSSGIQSNLNCAVASTDSQRYHKSHSLSRHIRGGRQELLSDQHNSFL
ncbi:Ecto-ADP-ribosyltransferase 5 [Triplophysa tibetana]|uniref:NAD(P)(+)--arginine ADP-ribosyltransferase n=1 Tax=Triplophysa tibetana TaxID=1572043 RepID=A0A5A9N8P1_9TELE|nr:Ecto-ADP-ribosyltransferase 5 [Triplophysa tibetana]